MVCKKCGAESAENAVFCGMCGARVDGKIVCKTCGALNDEKYAFCAQCGTRIDGKTTCRNCGQAYQGQYCPTCGHSAAKKMPVVHNVEKIAKRGAAMQTAKNIVEIVGGAFGMLAVLFSLIFVFFIGLNIKLGVMDTDMSDMFEELFASLIGDKCNIFYYFGQSFKDLKALNLDTTTYMGWAKNNVEITLCIFGLIIGIAALLSVVVCGAVATVIYICGWLKKTHKKPTGWTIACVASFLTSAALFYALHFCKVEMTVKNNVSSSMSLEILVDAKFCLNNATKVGIILSVIFLGLALLCRLFVAGRYALKLENLLKIVFSLVGLGIAITVFCLAQNAGLNIKGGDASQTMKIHAAVSQMSSLITTMPLDSDVALLKKLSPYIEKMLAYGIITQILTFALIIVSAMMMANRFANISVEKKSSGILWSSVAFGVAIALLVFAILAKSNLTEFFKIYEPETAVKGLGTYIVALAFTAVNLVLSIVMKAVVIKKETVYTERDVLS